jgi:hypothetical protein
VLTLNRMRFCLPVLTLLAACLSAVAAVAPAQAATRGIRCTGDGSSIHPNGTARYFCTIRQVKPNVVISVPKGQGGCDTYRSFEAESSGGYVANGFKTYDHRSAPGRSFTLSDDDRDSRSDELHKMRVRVYDNNERLRFKNLSEFAVNITFSLRCPLE